MKQNREKLYVLLVFALLTVTTLIAYEPLRRNDFVNYDDRKYVVENPHVQEGITYKSLVWAFTTPHMGNWHPVTWLSHIIDCQMFGLKAGRHHLISLLFHILNTLLLFWVFRKMTGALWCSAFVAAAFALHPLHVESVAWASERKDILSTFFWLLTMWAYVQYVRHKSLTGYILIVVFFSLGLMAKPMLVTLPFVLLLLDYWPLGRLQMGTGAKSAEVWKTAAWLTAEKIPLFFLAGVLCIVTFLSQQAIGAVNQMGLIRRTAVGVISYSSYIQKMIWPSKLAVFYPLPSSINRILLAGSAILLLCITVAAVYWRLRRPWFLAGWLWYIGTLVPVIGLVKVGGAAMADRYTYVPLTGLFIIIAWGADEFCGRWRYARMAIGIPAVSAIAVLVVCSHIQAGYWRNSKTLFEHTLAVTERNYLAHHNLGWTFQKEGMINEAVKHFRAAVEINAGLPEHHWSLGEALAKQGWINEAITQFRKAVELEKGQATAHKRLGRFLFNHQRFDEAALHFAEAVKLEPNSAEAHNNLGAAMVEQGNLEAAASEFRKALEIRNDYLAHVNLAAVLIKQGRVDEAIEHYQQAMKIDPTGQQAREGLKAALAKQNKK